MTRDRKLAWIQLAAVAFCLVMMVLCFALAAHAQIDIVVPISQGPYNLIGNNLTWANSGAGGVTNNFIMVPPSPDSSLCLYVENTDSISHTFSYSTFSVGNPQITSYTGNTTPWTPTINGQAVITANGTVSFYLASRSSSRIAISASGIGSTATATLYGVWTTQSACAQPLQVTIGSGTLYSLVACDRSVNTSLNAGINTVVAEPAAPFTKIFVCGISLTTPAGATAGASVEIGTGTAGVTGCSNYSNALTVNLPTTVYTYTFGQNIGFFFTGLGTPVCATVSASPGVTPQLFVNYAYQ